MIFGYALLTVFVLLILSPLAFSIQFGLKGIRWYLYIWVLCVGVISGKLLASWMVKNRSTEDKLNLVGIWQRIYATSDNDLTGDSYWKAKHLNGDDPLKDEHRIGWIKRNAFNAGNYRFLGVDNNPEFVSKYKNEAGVISGGPVWETDNAFLYRPRFAIPGAGRDLELFFGWALFGEKNGRCKLVFSIRLPKTGTGH